MWKTHHILEQGQDLVWETQAGSQRQSWAFGSTRQEHVAPSADAPSSAPAPAHAQPWLPQEDKLS